MSSNVMYTLKNALLNEEDYTIDNLKLDYGFNNDNSLMNFLLRLLKSEVELASFDTMVNDKSSIDVIYNYLMELVEKSSDLNIDKLMSYLLVINLYIDSKVTKINNLIKEDKYSVNIIEKTFWQDLHTYNNDLVERLKKEDRQNYVNYYCVLNELVYNNELKNITLLQTLNRYIPIMFSSKDENGIAFFDKLINYYVEIINNPNTPIIDLVYYDAVLDILLKNKYVIVDKNYKNILLDTIGKIKDSKLINRKERLQRQIFLDHIIKKLDNERDYVTDLDELNKKYKNNTVIKTLRGNEMDELFNSRGVNYHDFTRKDMVTIDPYSSFDLDDGMSIERVNNNYLLGIYIADVSSYVHFYSGDDLDALKRRETIYSSSCPISPMISDEIVYDKCSLLPNNYRKVIAYLFEVEPDGNIIRHQYKKGYVKTRRELCFSYGDVDKVLKYGSNNPRVQNALHTLQQVFRLDLFNGMISDTSLCTGGETESHLMIAKAMVLANYMVAEDAKKKGIPFLYRTHHINNLDTIISDNPNLLPLFDCSSNKRAESIKNIMSNCFSKASYSVEAMPHEALNLPIYAHTTSPIRRYSDLVNQRMIKTGLIDESLNDRNINELLHILKVIADDLNTNTLITNQYLNDYARIKK